MNQRLKVLIGLVGLLAASCRRGEVTPVGRAPVILISIDTLRADHLPLFGYKEVDTPNIDALRRDGILYTNAFCHVPLTLPSHVTVLTGLLPPDNKVRNNIGYKLDPAVQTLPGVLKANGYATGAAVSAYVLRSSSGLGQSFDFYDDAIASKPGTPVGSLQRPGKASEEIAARWIGEHERQPFFFFLHLFEPHSPYTPPEPFRSRFRSPYDGEIATADAIVGDLLEFLRKRGLYDKAIIILMSDHGEGLYEHGEPEHGIFLYREVIHVPLIVKLPSGAEAGRTVTRPVGLVDIMPTILSLTGINAPARLDGSSLTAAGLASRRIYSETLYPRIHLGWSELRSLEDGQYHLIQAPAPELYDMDRDPGEKTNVLAEQRRLYASLRAELDKYGGAIDLPKQIDPEEAKKLTALGYLGSSIPSTGGPLPDPKDRIGEVAAMVEAMGLSTEQKNPEAIAAFRAILAKNPRLADAWNQLALTLEASGRYEEAADAYRTAIRLTPELAGEFGLSLGSVLLKLDKLDEAAAHARLGEKVNPGGSRVLLARVAFAKKDYRQAEEQARIARNDPYAHLAATVLLAQIEASQERAPEAYALAEEAGREAQRQGEGAVESLDFARGDALARMQRYDEAIAAFGREIANFPRNKQAYANLALVYMLTNRPAEARETLDRMLRANPNRRAYFFAAHTLESLNDPGGAAALRRQGEKLK